MEDIQKLFDNGTFKIGIFGLGSIGIECLDKIHERTDWFLNNWQSYITDLEAKNIRSYSFDSKKDQYQTKNFELNENPCYINRENAVLSNHLIFVVADFNDKCSIDEALVIAKQSKPSGAVKIGAIIIEGQDSKNKEAYKYLDASFDTLLPFYRKDVDKHSEFLPETVRFVCSNLINQSFRPGIDLPVDSQYALSVFKSSGNAAVFSAWEKGDRAVIKNAENIASKLVESSMPGTTLFIYYFGEGIPMNQMGIAYQVIAKSSRHIDDINFEFKSEPEKNPSGIICIMKIDEDRYNDRIKPL